MMLGAILGFVSDLVKTGFYLTSGIVITAGTALYLTVPSDASLQQQIEAGNKVENGGAITNAFIGGATTPNEEFKYCN